MGPNVFTLSLSEPDDRRLSSYMPEITAQLCPGIEQHATYNGEIRCRRKGSLALYSDGSWMDYEADRGGPGGVSLIKHLTEWGDVDATRFARNWLKEHPGVGSFQIDPISEAAAQARDELYARRAQEAIDQRQPLADTISERNLLARGLIGPWPEGLGHLVAGRLAEQALIVPLTAPDGETLGVQLGYLTLPDGKKSTRMPARQQFWLTADPERRRTGLFRILAVPRAADDDVLKDTTLICEGAEKAIAIHMAFPAVPVFALCGIGRLTHIPSIPGHVVIVCDGDALDSAAHKLVVRGVDHLLQTGTSTVKITATPLRADADSIVKDGGVEALRELILAASPVELSFKGSTQKLAKIYDRFEFDAAREALAKRMAPLGIRKRTIDAEVAAARREDAADATPLDPAAALGPEPWPDHVDDIGAVLTQASDVIGRYVITRIAHGSRSARCRRSAAKLHS